MNFNNGGIAYGIKFIFYKI